MVNIYDAKRFSYLFGQYLYSRITKVTAVPAYCPCNGKDLFPRGNIHFKSHRLYYNFYLHEEAWLHHAALPPLLEKQFMDERN